MDIETLTNHIARFGKQSLDCACRLILKEAFDLNPINVDGMDDGGTDYVALSSDGTRRPVAYQITTQKSDIKGKAYLDAKKAIDKLGVNKFYFFTTVDLSETDARKLENEIEKELHIAASCFGARHIAGLILNDNLLINLLDEINYPLPRTRASTDFDYREIALHSYTLFSKDTADMKDGIYDDSIVYILSNAGAQEEDSLIDKVIEFLSLSDLKREAIKRRIGALFGRGRLKKKDKLIALSEDEARDLSLRKRIYEAELTSLSSAQIDLMHKDYGVNWTVEDSKKISIWIADAYISDLLTNLKEAKASIVSNPIFNVEANGRSQLFRFLKKEKKLTPEQVQECAKQLLEQASVHPLISKLMRATVYVALAGGNPISSAKALGAQRWSDFNMLIEPTVAIPYICSQLYSGHVNRSHHITSMALKKAKQLDIRLFISSYYINECAGHLLNARRYDGLPVSSEELQYSKNVFVSIYFTYKNKNARVPPTLMDFLASFSPSIVTQNPDERKWVRSLMTDIQSLLYRGNVEIIDTPQYNEEDTDEIKNELLYILEEKKTFKKNMKLVNDDVYALKLTNDRILNKDEHWIILTYDKSMITLAKGPLYSGWVTSPPRFIDFTDITQPLSEGQFVSLVHSVATYSEATLSAGARIIDRIVSFASKKMDNWEFKQDIEKFKNELLQSINYESESVLDEVDQRTDEFLLSHGITLDESEDEEIDI
ncbi:MAG TPA: hypothetical protein VGS79_27025 [Puia sp.]|nr:hypothetical protein [Puia sp.]